MKTYLAAILFFCSGLTLGEVDSDSLHASDYRRGYDAGFSAANIQTPEARVTGNLLCHYAEVACPKK